MEDDEDDLYGTSATGLQTTNGTANADPGLYKQENTSEEEEDGEQEEDDSDSDVDIITERPHGATTPPPQPSKSDRSIPMKHERTLSSNESPTSSKRQKTTHTPSQAQGPSQPPPQPQRTPQKPGTDYPEVRTSTISLDAEPKFDNLEKPISAVDIDKDLLEHSKAWRLPGADQSDYFNYGFDEYTWVQYCIRQGKMRSDIQIMGEEKAGIDKALAAGMGGMDPSGAMNPETLQQMMAIFTQAGAGGYPEGMGGYENMMAPMGPMGGGGMNGYGGQGMDGGHGGGGGGGGQNFRGRGRGRRF